MKVAVDRFVRRAAGNVDRLLTVRWREGGRRYECLVPGDNLWVCVKDDLLLREYEWLGASMDAISGTVVDAGAHVGTFSVMAAARADRLIAIEPNPAMAALLRFNRSWNQAANVEVRECALWREAGSLLLDTGARSSAGSSVVGAVSGVEVKSITLDDLVEETGPVSLLKIDIEGAEFETFDAASSYTLGRIDRIVGELHLSRAEPGAADRLRRRLEAEGFDVTITTVPFFHPASSLRQIRRHWRSVEGLLRLKLTLVAVYAGTAIVEPVFHLRQRLGEHDLRLLHAVRTSAGPPS